MKKYVIALALFICATGAVAGVDPSFEIASAQSHRDSLVPEGAAWEEKNAAESGPMFNSVVQACRKTAPNGTQETFSLLVSLGKHGWPLKVLVSPKTKFSQCVQSGVTGLKFPDAPWEGYWLRINMVD